MKKQQQPSAGMPAWLNDAVFYQIYPQSFYDSNGDGIGDLPGIIGKLDYIRSLGVNAIWLNPCYDSPFFDAGYDVRDYYKVAPRYGTNDDLVRLFDEAHKRGIRVVLDLVFTYMSIEHPWFRESCRPEPNEFTDRFIWTDSVFADADGMKNVHGYCDRDGNFIVNYFWTQPALNFGFADPKPEHPWQKPYDHPACEANRQELRKVIRFWLDRGADGFRVDMAGTFVKRDRNAGFKHTRMLFGEIRDMLDRDYPEAVLISEWGNPAQAIPCGFHVDYLLHYGPQAYVPLFRMNQAAQNNDPLAAGQRNKYAPDTRGSFFGRAGDGDIMLFLNQYLDWLDGIGGKGLISMPTSNHDMTRLCNGRDAQELKVCFAFILTMPGTPTIYYGDEIGIPYHPGLCSKEGGYYRTGSRTPMQWDRGANLGFSTAPAGRLYLPVQEGAGAVTVAEQDADGDSLLNTVRELTRLRQRHPALQTGGAFRPLYAQRRKYPFVYERSADGESIIIAVNPAAKEHTCEIGLPLASESISPLLVSGAQTRPANGCITVRMDGVSFGIWQVRRKKTGG